jgi:hypothetical protein
MRAEKGVYKKVFATLMDDLATARRGPHTKLQAGLRACVLVFQPG